MEIYSGAGENIYQSLAEAMGWLLQWLKGKADGSSLSSKGYERFEGIWAGHQVNTHETMHVLVSWQRTLACNMSHGSRKTLCLTVVKQMHVVVLLGTVFPNKINVTLALTCLQC